MYLFSLRLHRHPDSVQFIHARDIEPLVDSLLRHIGAIEHHRIHTTADEVSVGIFVSAGSAPAAERVARDVRQSVESALGGGSGWSLDPAPG